MKRRDFCEVSALAATGLILPATPGFATTDKDKGDVLALGPAQIALIVTGRVILLNYLYLVLSSGVWLINLLQPVQLVSEKKATLSKVPLLGKLGRKSMKSYMDGAKPVGKLYHNGKAVFAFPDVVLSTPPPPAGPIPVPYPTFSMSFRPNQSFKRAKTKNIPTKAKLQAAGTPVGTLLQAKDGSLIFGMNGIKVR
ncbi:hypothetical protein BCF46_0357 [Litoreibacter meonggei]|uniref:Uncharacterized protein n=1 Tax=Litoreibacter meonggei TaxID=1049199 RepID=A0A497X4N4_9RHOB|nr:hypothetical protein [Litoreibacter meonggei]RLJ60160.1 hypothetical protein BCF46_0357 [Litoreibacter meonggei]